MTLHVPRLRFSLDLLIAEAKRRARQRRLVLAALALVVAGAAAGITLGLPGSSGGHGLSTARFASYGMSFRYPAAWDRLDCRWVSTETETLTFMSTAHLRSACSKYPNGVFVSPTLGPNGVLVQWVEVSLPGREHVVGANARIGGQPARIWALDAKSVERPVCGAIGGQHVLKALLQDPALKGRSTLSMFSCYSGPERGATYRAVRELLASVRFTP